MKRLMILPAVLFLFCVGAGCATTPVQRAFIANTSFAAAVDTASVLHANGEIKDDVFDVLTAAANAAQPFLDELNSYADQYDAAQKAGASAADLAAIRFNGERVWSSLEPRLLDLAGKVASLKKNAATRISAAFFHRARDVLHA